MPSFTDDFIDVSNVDPDTWSLGKTALPLWVQLK